MSSFKSTRLKHLLLLAAKSIGVLVALAIVLIPGLTAILVNGHFLKKIEAQAKQSDSHIEEFKRDLLAIEKNQIFHPTTTGSDAAPTFVSYVPWMGAKTPPSEADKNYAPVENFLRQHTAWATSREVLITASQDIALRTLEVDWMNALTEKSHWSLTNHPFVATTIERASNSNSQERLAEFSNMPIPRYDALRNWAVIYLMKTAHDGSPRLGLEMFHKTAELIYSQGTLAAQMVALQMLTREAHLASAFAIEDWSAPPTEIIEAYKRVSWGWTGFVQTAWLNPISEDLTRFMSPQFGVCAAAFENVGGLHRMYDFLGRTFIFESDFSAQLQASRSLDQHLLSLCKMDAFQAFSNPTPEGSNPIWMSANKSQKNSDWALNHTRIPYLRRLLGLQLMMITFPNYFQLYEKKSS